MHLYEQIDTLCKQNNTNITAMCKEAGVSRSALSDYKAGRIKSISRSNLQKIANYFKIDIACFTGENTPYCKECGIYYASDIPKEIEYHNLKHGEWENAVNKYGFCWPYSVREEIKRESSTILGSAKFDFTDKINAAINILKCYFSRSLESSHYSLDHVEFSDYSAMLLNQENFKKTFEHDIWSGLVDLYGTKKGIPDGTYYSTDGVNKLDDKIHSSLEKNGKVSKNITDTIKTIAAHLEGSELKDNQIEDVLNFIDFIKQKDL